MIVNFIVQSRECFLKWILIVILKSLSVNIHWSYNELLCLIKMDAGFLLIIRKNTWNFALHLMFIYTLIYFLLLTWNAIFIVGSGNLLCFSTQGNPEMVYIYISKGKQGLVDPPWFLSRALDWGSEFLFVVWAWLLPCCMVLPFSSLRLESLNLFPHW